MKRLLLILIVLPIFFAFTIPAGYQIKACEYSVYLINNDIVYLLTNNELQQYGVISNISNTICYNDQLYEFYLSNNTILWREVNSVVTIPINVTINQINKLITLNCCLLIVEENKTLVIFPDHYYTLDTTPWESPMEGIWVWDTILFDGERVYNLKTGKLIFDDMSAFDFNFDKSQEVALNKRYILVNNEIIENENKVTINGTTIIADIPVNVFTEEICTIQVGDNGYIGRHVRAAGNIKLEDCYGEIIVIDEFGKEYKTYIEKPISNVPSIGLIGLLPFLRRRKH